MEKENFITIKNSITSSTFSLKLEKIKFTDELTDYLVENLENNTDYKFFDLFSCEITDKATDLFTKIIKNNKKISAIRISECTISDESLSRLISEIKNLPELNGINLSKNNIHDQVLLNSNIGLSSYNNLNWLYLSHNSISDEGAKIIAQLVKNNKNLKMLDLSFNKLQASGSSALADSLANHENLYQLDLNNNEIHCGGIEELGRALAINNSLCILKLNHNNICDKGIKSLCSSLKSNKKLSELNLGNNQLSLECIDYFYELLTTNNTIQNIITDPIVNNKDKDMTDIINFYLIRNKILNKKEIFITLQNEYNSKKNKLETTKETYIECLIKILLLMPYMFIYPKIFEAEEENLILKEEELNNEIENFKKIESSFFEELSDYNLEMSTSKLKQNDIKTNYNEDETRKYFDNFNFDFFDLSESDCDAADIINANLSIHDDTEFINKTNNFISNLKETKHIEENNPSQIEEIKSRTEDILSVLKDTLINQEERYYRLNEKLKFE